MLIALTLALLTQIPCQGAWQPPVPGSMGRPFISPISAWGAGHRGIDLAALPGDPVRSPVDGILVFSGSIAGRPVLVVEDSQGLRATLEPVSGTSGAGSIVKAGDLIGVVGVGGHCDRRCVHLGARQRGTREYRNPAGLLTCHPVLKPTGGD